MRDRPKMTKRKRYTSEFKAKVALAANGQPNDRTALAVAEIRVRLSERLRDRLRGEGRGLGLSFVLVVGDGCRWGIAQRKP